jgi:hypothetical protein
VLGAAACAPAEVERPASDQPVRVGTAPLPGRGSRSSLHPLTSGTVPEPAPLVGTIVERADAGPYTYLRLRTPEGDVWAAVPATTLEVGTLATIDKPMLVKRFESRTLARTFERIYFGTLANAGPPSRPAPTLPPPVRSLHVRPLDGGTSVTVADVFARRAELKDQVVSVRAQVVKVIPQVLGRCWLHLRDGSGSKEAKDHDLTVTTTARAAVGDIVLVTGTLRLDREVGPGYAYPVLLEDAAVEASP